MAKKVITTDTVITFTDLKAQTDCSFVAVSRDSTTEGCYSDDGSTTGAAVSLEKGDYMDMGDSIYTEIKSLTGTVRITV